MFDFSIPSFFINVIYLLIFIFIIFLIRNFILQYLRQRLKEKRQFRLYKIYSNYIFVLFILLFILPTFLPSLKELVTVLSIFGAGILIVFKEIILNLYGFFYLIIRKPFQVGDRIRIQDYYGDILDVRLLDFTILQLYPQHLGGQSSGRVVNIPNSYVFLYPLANFSKEFSFNWTEIQIPLTIKSNWKKAENISLEIINQILYPVKEDDRRIQYSQQEYAIQFSKLTPKTFVEFSRGSIVITLRFLCEPKKQRLVKDEFWRKFLEKSQTLRSISLHENFDNRSIF